MNMILSEFIEDDEVYRLYYLKDEPIMIFYNILLYYYIYYNYVYVMTVIISVSRNTDKFKY